MLREDEELVRRTRYMPDGIPDTLYMVEEKPTPSSYGLSSLDVLTASIPSIKIIVFKMSYDVYYSIFTITLFCV